MNVLLTHAEEKQRLLPDSGRHALIRHEFDLGYNAGSRRNVVLTNSGVTVNIRNSQAMNLPAEYLSEEIDTFFDAKELVMTWNASVPIDTWLVIEFRVRDKYEDWSVWYDMGHWGQKRPYERITEDPVYGPLKVDILKAYRKFNKIQYRIRFYGSKNNGLPTLKRITLCYTNPPDENKDALRSVRAPVGPTISLPVPWISQLRFEDVEDMDMINAGVCAPTSLTMVMKFLGKPLSVKETAQQAFDPVSEVYGNWAFLAATAANQGLRAWVQRFNTWEEVRRLVEKGIPVIISIAYPKGTFSSEPESSSDGHLMVVKGFTKAGDVIVNNPGTFFHDKGESIVYKWYELGKAFFGHGGVGIVVTKE